MQGDRDSRANDLPADRGPGEDGLVVWRSIALIGLALSAPPVMPSSSPPLRARKASLRAASSASSFLTIFSYSRSCPRKLKFGEIVGRLSLTYLYASSEDIFICFMI